jgi:hypothetical protein
VFFVSWIIFEANLTTMNRTPSTEVNVIIRPSTGAADINMKLPLSTTILDIRNDLKKQNKLATTSNAKFVFGGRFVSDNDTLMQLLENYDVNVTHTIHLIGGVAPQTTTPAPTSQPTTPLTTTTPLSATTPTPQQIQQLMQQQILMMGNNGNTTPGTNTPQNFQQQQQVLAQLQRLQEMQLQLAQLQARQQQAQQPQQNAPQQPLDPNQIPQRLVDDRPRNQIVINIRIGPVLTVLFRIAILCIILFPRLGWLAWLKFTTLFSIGYFLFQYGGVLLDFFRGPRAPNQPAQQQAQQAPVNNQDQNANQGNAPQAVPVPEEPRPTRGPMGTLLHIIYLFVVSLSPTYQPRGFVAIPPEDLHED